jgi:hypothetical protein
VELPHRFSPATLRQRELIATRLGLIQKIEIDVPVPSADEQHLTKWMDEHQALLAGLLNWCVYLIGTCPPQNYWMLSTDRPELHLQFEESAG